MTHTINVHLAKGGGSDIVLVQCQPPVDYLDILKAERRWHP